MNDIGIEKKKKGKPQSRPTIVGYVAILVLVGIFLGCCYMASDLLLYSDMENSTYYTPITPLAPDLLPTAYAILDNPDSEGDFANDYTVRIRGYCFDIIKQNRDATDYSSVKIFVNDQEIQHEISDLTDTSSCYQLIATMLEGMYIVEIQLMDAALNPIAIYRHAIEIE